MPYHYLLTASGPDCPGLVAQVTRVLYRLGCNLEDSSMTRLRGEFSILLIFSSSKPFVLKTLDKAFREIGRKNLLTVHVKLLTTPEMKKSLATRPLTLITAYGTDRPGLVYRLTERLARSRVNVTDVTTHRSASRRGAGYILILEAELPASLTRARLQNSLRPLARRLGMTVTVKPVDSVAL
ncbi:MAG TPA: ACT domain-containing protein [Elusimicrobiota bacterium]|nr:ACT domain-containing protein [Elusimicrobiota bacterium]